MLWVDDNLDNNLYEAAALKAIGADIVYAHDTEAAVDALRRNSFEVIISDMSRPSGRTAGFDLLEQLQKISKETPFIVYAGSSPPEYVADGKARGAFAYTSQPNDLVRAVVEAVLLGTRR